MQLLYRRERICGNRCYNFEKNDVNLTEYSHVVVIPNVGCGGCISEAEHFFVRIKRKIYYLSLLKYLQRKVCD